MDVLIVCVVGLMLGSFLSVLIGRWPEWRGVGMGRSHCPHCMHVLAWYDLIPLVSWLSVRGKCRYCAAPIARLYPALELTMAAVLGAYVFQYGVSTVWNITDGVVLAALVALFFFDLKHQMLPDAIVIPLGLGAILRLVALHPELLVSSIVTGVVIASVFGSLYVVSRGRWLGFGDVKLGLVMGLVFGYPNAIGVTLVAIWAGALVGLALMALRRANMQTAIPFGSFWTAVAVCAVIWPMPIQAVSRLFIPIYS